MKTSSYTKITRETPIRILMVDDSRTDVYFAKEAFAREKIETIIEVVPDGVEALSFLHGEGDYKQRVMPNIILLDLNMPRKNGQQTLQEIKSDSKLRSLPVIVLTTSNAPGDIDGAYHSYANCYIAKPGDYNGYAEIVCTIRDFWLNLAQLPSCS